MLGRRGQPRSSVPRWRRARGWALVTVAVVAVVVAVVLLRRPGDGHPLPERDQPLDAPVAAPLIPVGPSPLEAYRSIEIDPPLDHAPSIDRYDLTHIIDALEEAEPLVLPAEAPAGGDGVLDGDPWRLRTIWQVVLAAGVLAWVWRRLTRPARTGPTRTGTDPQTESSSVAAVAMSSTCGSTADSSVGS